MWGYGKLASLVRSTCYEHASPVIVITVAQGCMSLGSKYAVSVNQPHWLFPFTETVPVLCYDCLWLWAVICKQSRYLLLLLLLVMNVDVADRTLLLNFHMSIVVPAVT